MKIYKIKVNGKNYRVELEAVEEVKSEAVKEEKKAEAEPKKVSTDSSLNQVLSPIQGQVVAIKVKPGDKVKKGDVLLLVEAMKLENEVVSPFDGEVVEVLANKGQNVASKDLLVTIR